MENIAVSIIIPVYKAEKYIRRCLDSVVNQTCSDYEVVLIDDGSLDNSGNICDDYAAKYPMLKVFHQENMGVTRTREVGIEKAKGQYIVWVDADDTADSKLVECVVNAFRDHQTDLVLYGVQYHERGIVTKKQIPVKESLEMMRRKSITGQYSTLWRFAVPRKFWFGEKAPGEMERSAADGYMAIRLFMKASHVQVVPQFLYYHLVDNPDSIRHTFNGKRYMGNFYLWYYRLRICESKFPDLCLHCASRALSGAVKAYSMSLVFHDLPEEYQEELLKSIQYLKKYSIRGRWRDKFLGWCLLHHIEEPCRIYAYHKIKKTERDNKKVARNEVKAK